MKKLLLLLAIFLIASCTFRSYEVNFNYYVGNNGTEEITWDDYEKYKEEVAEKEAEVTEPNKINIPKGSGNLTIYIQAEVPKHIETTAEAELTPLSGSVIGK